MYTVRVAVTGVAEETARLAIMNAVDGFSLPCAGVDLNSLEFEESKAARGILGSFTVEKPINHKPNSAFVSAIETGLRALITVQLFSVKTLKIFVDIIVN